MVRFDIMKEYYSTPEIYFEYHNSPIFISSESYIYEYEKSIQKICGDNKLIVVTNMYNYFVYQVSMCLK